MQPQATHLHRDDDGVLLVGTARVSMDAVMAAFRAGKSAKAVRDRYPALSEEEVAQAIAYAQNDPDDVIPNHRDPGHDLDSSPRRSDL